MSAAPDYLAVALARNAQALAAATSRRKAESARHFWMRPEDTGEAITATDYRPRDLPALPYGQSPPDPATRDPFTAAHPLGFTRQEHRLALFIASGEGGRSRAEIDAGFSLSRAGLHELVGRIRRKIDRHSVVLQGFPGIKGLIVRYRFSHDLMPVLSGVRGE